MTTHSFARWLQPDAALAVALAMAFAFGGSARSDAWQLMVLHPFAVMLFALALATTDRAAIARNRTLLTGMAAALVLVLVQLVPLPAGLWAALPGREAIRAVDDVLGLAKGLRPLTIDSLATRATLAGLALPFAVALLAIRLDTGGWYRTLRLVVALGAVSTVLAILQPLADPNGPLYLYRWTNNGAMVGLFANRNHQAVFMACLLPCVTVVLSEIRFQRTASQRLPGSLRNIALIAAIALIITLVLVTGSRAGLGAAFLALVSTPLILSATTTLHRSRRRIAAWAVGCLAVLILATAAVSQQQRDLALDRLIGTDEAAEMRGKILPVVQEMVATYWPWGSGFGSFAKLYQLHEPVELLAPTYMNQAHNDVLQLLIEGGLPAVILVVGLMALIAVQTWRRERLPGTKDDRKLGRAGLAVLVILGFASLFDYPLRTPALACLAALAVVLASRRPNPNSQLLHGEELRPTPVGNGANPSG